MKKKNNHQPKHGNEEDPTPENHRNDESKLTQISAQWESRGGGEEDCDGDKQ